MRDEGTTDHEGTTDAELDAARRWQLIESAMGAIPGEGHKWDEDPGEWVRDQRRGDSRRVG